MEAFDRDKQYKPKKRHGNRKPVIPVHTRPNAVRIYNAAARMAAAYNKPDYDPAHQKLWEELKRMDKQVDHLLNIIDYLDNQID